MINSSFSVYMCTVQSKLAALKKKTLITFKKKWWKMAKAGILKARVKN